MSEYNDRYLNANTLIGYTSKRGPAWHYREDLQGDESNHYDYEIPMEDVHRRLFNWTPVKTPLSMNVGDTEDDYRTVPGWVAIRHPDTNRVLGVHGEGYSPHPYGEWLVDNVAGMLGDAVRIGSAGILRYGAQAWVSIEMEETLSVAGLDYRPQLLAYSSLDGSLASSYQDAVTATVCDNTFAQARKEGSVLYKVKSTSRSKFDTNRALEVLGLLEATAKLFAEQVERYTGTKVTDEQFGSFLDAYVPIPKEEGRGKTIATKKRESFLDLWENDERVSPWRGTQFGVLQAANTYEHHLNRAHKGMSRFDRNMTNAIKGTTAKADAKAMETLERVLVDA